MATQPVDLATQAEPLIGEGRHSAERAAQLFKTGQIDQALLYSQEAVKLCPSPSNQNRHSAILLSLGRCSDALEFADLALRDNPSYPEALYNKSLSLMGVGNSAEAIRIMTDVRVLVPNNAMVNHALALLHLRLGNLCKATWQLFDYRLLLNSNQADLSSLRIWRGETIVNKTLLIHAEEGLGDTIQFARYVPLAAVMAGRVVLAVQKPLIRLLQDLPGVDNIVAVGETLPAFDVLCPMLSLPYIFGTELHTIPPPQPLIRNPVHSPVDNKLLRVGLVWAGSKSLAADQRRSIDPNAFLALAGLSNVQFYSLQKPEIGQHHLPPALQSIDAMDGIADFRDTASKILDLDLVIAVDTAVAHLAATMGKPVWLLSRTNGCWRWLQDRTDSPWYKSIKIYQQRIAGEWGHVLEKIRSDLLKLTAQH